MVWLCLWFKVFANPHGTTNSCVFPYRVFVLKKKKKVYFSCFPHPLSLSLIITLSPEITHAIRTDWLQIELWLNVSSHPFFFFPPKASKVANCSHFKWNLIAQIQFPPMMMESIALSLWWELGKRYFLYTCFKCSIFCNSIGCWLFMFPCTSTSTSQTAIPSQTTHIQQAASSLKMQGKHQDPSIR